MRRLWIALLALGLGCLVASAGPVGVGVGGKGDKGKSGGGCHGAFCIGVDVGKIIDKVAAPDDKPAPEKPTEKSATPPAVTPQTPNTQVCVHKFNDLNGNGVKDWNEPPLANWSFTAVSAGFGTTPLGATGPGGGVCFTTAWTAGVYTMTETAQAGWIATSPGGQSQTFTLTPGQNVDLTFGNRYVPNNSPGIVCVAKYNDLNGNGIRDSGEPGLTGWLFAVRDSSNALIDFGTTDAQGNFCTTHPLSAGSYKVAETAQAGWVSTDPGGSAPFKMVTVVGGATTNVAFGNRQPPPPQGQICVRKFNDLNGNGILNTGEPGLAGWQFTVTGPSGPLTLTTGSNGTACTPQSLTLGSYVVTEVMQAGWTNTVPAGSTPHRTVMVMAGPSTTDLLFGNAVTVPGQICILKYWDLNHNGHLNTGEPPLAGWSFIIRDSSGTQIATGVTGSDGRYCTAPNLALGTYDVSEVSQAWWVNTEPLGPPMAQLPAHKTVTVVATQVSQVQFGNIKAGRLCVHKYADLNGNGQRDTGEPPLAGWTFHTQYTSWASIYEDFVTTDTTGTACVFLPPNPEHLLYEDAQSGWVNTDPGMSGWIFKIYTIVEGQTTDVYVGNRQIKPALGMICVAKYNDANHNGAFDVGEWTMPGWHFTVKNASGVTIGTLITSSAPRACMEVPNGSYKVLEAMQTAWVSSDPGGSAPQKTVTVSNGAFVSLMFGNYEIGLP